MTPEGKVKDMIKKLLEEFGMVPASKALLATENNTGKYVMPVPNGMGVAGIPDFYGHFYGFFFEIEAKDFGKEPTQAQKHQLDATRKTGAMSFVVDGAATLEFVRLWLRQVQRLRG